MVDDEDEFESPPVDVWQPPDPSGWSDAQFHRAVALLVFTAEMDELVPDEQPNYDW